MGKTSGSNRKPWFAPSKSVGRDSSVAIIGAGIAGATLAHVLTREGLEVCVYERNAGAAREGSGNPVGIFNPSLTLSDDPISEFRESAFLHAVRFLEGAAPPSDWGKSGIVQISHSTEAQERQDRLIALYGESNIWFDALSKEEVAAELGMSPLHAGLLMKSAGWVAPVKVCAALLEGKTCHFNSNVSHIVPSEEGWNLYGGDQEYFGSAGIIVFANAGAARDFTQTSHLPFKRNRGQISFVPSSGDFGSAEKPSSYGGYVTPPFIRDEQSFHVVGATYRETEGSEELELSPEDHVRNLAALQRGLGIDLSFDPGGLDGRVSYRVRTPDRLPVIGPLPIAESFRRAFETVRYGNRFERFPGADYHTGLFVLAGLGSRGFQWAPLAAEIVAAEMLGLPSPVSREVLEIVHPARFLLRELRRA